MKQEVDKIPLEIEIDSVDDNCLKLLWFTGHIKVGGFLVGDDFYCNKILGIKVDGKNTDMLYSTKRIFSRKLIPTKAYPEGEVEIILEHTYCKPRQSVTINEFLEDKPIRSQFRVSKSN